MSQLPAFDASIPVLTEVLHDTPPVHQSHPPATLAVLPLNATTAPAAVPVPAEPMAVTVAEPLALEAQAVHQFDDGEWALLERRLSERILHQLQGRVDFVLEQRIKDSMEEVLSHALRDLTMEIRNGLHDTLSKIVTRAVTQELTHLQAQKK
ncbi:MAG: hypothetical protein V4724_25635 [Pseudomonadota bacterium]